MWTPGRVLRWYLTFSVASIVIFIVLLMIVGGWPRLLPIIIGALVSLSIVLGYIAWRDYLR